jgi:hypothetical protein
MKMGDGSFRAAYNVQIKTAVGGAHIVGVSVTDRGSDYGLLGEAVGEIERRYGGVSGILCASGPWLTLGRRSRDAHQARTS